MYLEKGTIYRVDCGEMPTSEFAEKLLLLVNQKSSNSDSGILDVETVYGTNHFLVTVRDSACKYKMNEYLSTMGEVTEEPIILGTDSHDEQRYGLENNEIKPFNNDVEAHQFIKQLKDNKTFISYRGFVIEN